MSRHVPELALVTGAFLGLSAFGAGVLLTGDYLRTTLFAAAVLYPFAGYAAAHVDDPTAVLPPDAVGVAGLAGGAFVFVAALADPLVRPSVGLVLGVAVAFPAMAYAGRGRDAGGERRAVAVGAVGGVAVLVAGVAAGRPADGAIVGTVVVLLPALYATLTAERRDRER